MNASTLNETPSLFAYSSVAERIGKTIADGILRRIETFPHREAVIGGTGGRMDSLPEDILWEGLGEEAAPIFVVYKLIHEALSNAPQFFRAALVEFMRAQPTRFTAVFNRETIWAALATLPQLDLAPMPSLTEFIAKRLKEVQQRGIWWRSDAEIKREAEMVFAALLRTDGGLQSGFRALRTMQLEKSNGITAGNILLYVPGRLAAFAEEIVRLGEAKSLPPLNEINDRIDEFARDQPSDVRHQSVPLDLLYTSEENDSLHIRVLGRTKANKAERADIRRRALYLRYFVRRAFKGYQPHQVDIKVAFHLDDPRTMTAWLGPESVFHSEELMNRSAFWNELCPGTDPDELFASLRGAATKELTAANVVTKLKAHFARSTQK